MPKEKFLEKKKASIDGCWNYSSAYYANQYLLKINQPKEH